MNITTMTDAEITAAARAAYDAVAPEDCDDETSDRGMAAAETEARRLGGEGTWKADGMIWTSAPHGTYRCTAQKGSRAVFVADVVATGPLAALAMAPGATHAGHVPEFQLRAEAEAARIRAANRSVDAAERQSGERGRRW